MQYLSLALYAEGPTDYRFLSPLLQRLCEDICLRDALDLVEVSEVLALDDSDETRKESRGHRILDAARRARGAWRILFVHADGESNPDRSRQCNVAPALDLLRMHMSGDGVGVGVVPVHEIESWILADGDALREVFSTSLSDRKLGVPAPASVEGEPDPKRVLEHCYDLARPGARSRRQTEVQYFQELGECVALDALRRLKSFRSLEAELRQALRELKIIRG